MSIKKTAIVVGLANSIALSAAHAEINVVTSIKPIHSLVSGVMAGVGVPEVIIEGAGSPHTYSLKPSQATQLQNADLVFWMGDELEAFLEGPVENIAESATSINLMNAHGLKKIKFREGGMFDDHGHDDHDGHGDRHDHGHDDHDHEKHAMKEHDDHGHDDHGHGEFDPHVWLDPINAKAMVHAIEEALVKADPENASIYEANAHEMMVKLDSLVVELRDELEPVHDKGFVVFHDAYQYFEQRFDVAAIGSITVSPEVMPGAKRVGELREKISGLNATCVFSEPQFEPKLIETLVDGTKVRTGVLDPLGASLDKGPDLYFQLLRNMSFSLKKCLSGDN
ncbi:MAG: zinc ABC transporter substrate-binding protein ZnuA [Alphaproteobacteria bacterium]|nr:zinc ABC transporter substrate-binding protein ZnuA [Alphaproteobacteria bacterium]